MWHHLLPLMNSWITTRQLFYPCKLCFLRTSFSLRLIRKVEAYRNGFRFLVTLGRFRLHHIALAVRLGGRGLVTQGSALTGIRWHFLWSCSSENVCFSQRFIFNVSCQLSHSKCSGCSFYFVFNIICLPSKRNCKCLCGYVMIHQVITTKWRNYHKHCKNTFSYMHSLTA